MSDDEITLHSRCIDLSDDRRVECFMAPDCGWYFKFFNKGELTELKLTHEGLSAVLQLANELMAEKRG